MSDENIKCFGIKTIMGRTDKLCVTDDVFVVTWKKEKVLFPVAETKMIINRGVDGLGQETKDQTSWLKFETNDGTHVAWLLHDEMIDSISNVMPFNLKRVMI